MADTIAIQAEFLLALWGKLIFAIGLGRQFAGAGTWRTCLRWRQFELLHHTI